MPEFPDCPSTGPERLEWLDAFDVVMWRMARTDRLRLEIEHFPTEEINRLLEITPDYLAGRIRGAFEAEQLDWQMSV